MGPGVGGSVGGSGSVLPPRPSLPSSLPSASPLCSSSSSSAPPSSSSFSLAPSPPPSVPLPPSAGVPLHVPPAENLHFRATAISFETTGCRKKGRSARTAARRLHLFLASLKNTPRKLLRPSTITTWFHQAHLNSPYFIPIHSELSLSHRPTSTGAPPPSGGAGSRTGTVLLSRGHEGAAHCHALDHPPSLAVLAPAPRVRLVRRGFRSGAARAQRFQRFCDRRAQNRREFHYWNGVVQGRRSEAPNAPPILGTFQLLYACPWPLTGHAEDN